MKATIKIKPPLPPQPGRKQRQHGVQLQPSCQHVKAEQLGRGREVREAAHGADHFETRAYVVEAGQHRCKRRYYVESIQRKQQHRQGEQQHVNVEVVVYAAQHFLVQGLALKTDGGDGVGVQHLVQVLLGRL